MIDVIDVIDEEKKLKSTNAVCVSDNGRAPCTSTSRGHLPVPTEVVPHIIERQGLHFSLPSKHERTPTPSLPLTNTLQLPAYLSSSLPSFFLFHPIPNIPTSQHPTCQHPHSQHGFSHGAYHQNLRQESNPYHPLPQLR